MELMIASFWRYDYSLLRARVFPSTDPESWSGLQYWHRTMLGGTTLCLCGYHDVHHWLARRQVRLLFTFSFETGSIKSSTADE